ncbi:protein phosphatase 4, regulatory subunit 2 [Apophysomyces sp. BC1034]|nr:protein phosphatase 4, regulatory subunit 2 [Apophysomyces sp. BC1015]KAG0180467.1 protein phosphatase 4, regulatory subunit 2 [Apophysomyces sp. BC1021]KAG0191027.1 protein phosphatase 4, regulatory subunit 2 [Apophysomyces sp. BC1034]
MSDSTATDQAGPDQSQKPDDVTSSPKIVDTDHTSQEISQTDRTNSDLVEIDDNLSNVTYDPVLKKTAETNEVTIPWSDLKEIIKSTVLKHCELMEHCTSDAAAITNIDNIKTNIIHCIDRHSGPPFTIQRLCELIIEPRRHYAMFIKYLHAIEKVLFVTSTWHEYPENLPKTNGAQDDHSSSNQGALFATRALHDGVELEPISFDTSPSTEDTVDQEREQDTSVHNDTKENPDGDKKASDGGDSKSMEEDKNTMGDETMSEKNEPSAIKSTDNEKQETDSIMENSKAADTPCSITSSQDIEKTEESKSTDDDVIGEPMEID